MAEVLYTELKEDLENVYSKTRNLLDLLQSKDFGKESSEMKELMDTVMFRLEDMEGTLQKDIYNCDYLITKFKVLNRA
ncbi:MAG: hypothetical protein N3I35_07765 [Clostridia bacterium]|nr:hypothetical protein [Clostridia bacterium]